MIWLAMWLYLPTGYEHGLEACGDGWEAHSWQRTGRCTVVYEVFMEVA